MSVLIVERPRSVRGGQSRRFSDPDYLRRLKQHYQGDVTLVRTATIDEVMHHLRHEHVDFVVGMTAPAVGREIHRLLKLAEGSVERGAVFLLLEDGIDSRLPTWELSIAFLLISPINRHLRSRFVPRTTDELSAQVK